MRKKLEALDKEIRELLAKQPKRDTLEYARLGELMSKYFYILFDIAKDRTQLLEVYLKTENPEKPIIAFELNTHYVHNLKKAGMMFGQIMVQLIKDRAKADRDLEAEAFFMIVNAMMEEIAHANFSGVDVFPIVEPAIPKRHLDS